MPSSSAKSHHYVPASYLRRFTDDDGFLHIYDSRRSQLRRQRPEKVMKVDQYYRQCWAPAGIDPNVFENELGAWLEAKASPVLERLMHTHYSLTEDEAAILLVFMEIQRIRVPRQAKAGLELMRQTIERDLPEALAARVRDGELQVVMKEFARFDYMRLALGSMHPWLAQMEWEVVTAAEGSRFITTDSPVHLYNPGAPPPAEPGIALAGTIVLYPLSCTHLLIMRHPKCRTAPPLEPLATQDWTSTRTSLERGRVWSRAAVASTNWKMAMLAHELIATADPDTLRETGWNGIESLA